jgi:hypothetical protein
MAVYEKITNYIQKKFKVMSDFFLAVLGLMSKFSIVIWNEIMAQVNCIPV